jgi:hypothetical protein
VRYKTERPEKGRDTNGELSTELGWRKERNAQAQKVSKVSFGKSTRVARK